MKRTAGVFCLVVVLCLTKVAFADSNPYLSSGPLDLASASSAASCQTTAGSNSYDCQVKPSFNAAPFTDCYEFISPGSVSTHFDLVPFALAEELGCSCEPTGSFNNTKFNSSPNKFDCDS